MNRSVKGQQQQQQKMVMSSFETSVRRLPTSSPLILKKADMPTTELDKGGNLDI
jgi:hypothetical protein